MEAIVLAVSPLLVVVKMLLNFSNCCTKTQSCSLSLVVSIATGVGVPRSIAENRGEHKAYFAAIERP